MNSGAYAHKNPLMPPIWQSLGAFFYPFWEFGLWPCVSDM